MKILWNFLCQYNNVYISLYKYLQGKKKHKPIAKKKKNVAIVAILPFATVVTVQNLEKKVAHETKAM